MRRMVVYLDGSANDRESLACAVMFCSRLQGRLSVVHIREPSHIIPTMIEGAGAIIDNRARSEAAASEARRAFDEICKDLPFAAFSESDRDTVDAISQHGFVHDVTILERLSSTEGAEVMDFNAALFGTGGPVLITPPRAVECVGHTVAVVWSNSVQSARALRSSVPLLRVASRVVVLTNADNPQADPAEVVRYLDCHGVRCESNPFPGKNLTARGRGRALLEAARTCGADTLVMGAYGESRISAMLGLGRATEKVVTACAIPLLMQA
jgi:nucleotide-binding universal stress UspA family protein